MTQRSTGGAIAGRAPSLIPALLVLAAGMGAGVTPARAQVVFTPMAGTMVPTANVYEQPGAIGTARQTTAFAAGGRLTLSATGHVGLEAGLIWAPSNVRITTTAGTVDRSSSMLLGSLRLIFVLNSRWDAVNVYFAAGAGLVRRSGDAFTDVDGLTDVTGNVAFGTLFRAGSAFRIRLEMEDYLYQTRFTLPGGEQPGPRFQNDLVFSLGVSIPII